jgi:hypothetical protein
MRWFVLLLLSSMAVGQSPKGVASGKASDQHLTVYVPFVGCSSDGQVGPLDAPKSASVPVLATMEQVSGLAYYKSENGVGVLAPRGWHCFGTYGSGGDTLYVTPQPINAASVFPNASGLSDGPAIVAAYRFGGTSGRFTVAAVIARVFPAYESFARKVASEPDLTPFTSGPYPNDELVYRSEAVVEYRTPAQSEGLGTSSWAMSKGSLPIEGAAIIVGDEPDLALLSVRLPSELNKLTATLIRQFERDVSHCPCD